MTTEYEKLAIEKLEQASQALQHCGSLLYAIEHAVASGLETKIDILSFAEIGTRIAGNASEAAQEWADLISKGEQAEGVAHV
jgi:hypothetical protein